MWFGKNELRLYLNRAKKISIGGGRGPRGPPLNTPMAILLTHLVAEMQLSVLILAFIDILPQLNTPNRIQETQYPFDACAEV